MKILLTGASGILGTPLLKALQNCNAEVKALVHKTPLKIEGIETITGDLNDLEVLDSATKGIDTVVHFAAVTRSNYAKDYLKVNWEGTRDLHQASIRNGVQRFIYMSSRAAGLSGGAYSISKQKSEELVMQGTLPWVILRPSEVYGAGSPDSIHQLIQWIKNFKLVPIIGNGQYKLSPVFVEDLIPAFVEVVLKPNITDEVFTFCGPEELTFIKLVERLSNALKVQPTKFFIPVNLMKIAVNILVLLGIDMLVKDQVARLISEKTGDNKNSQRLLSYNPRILEEGLQSIN
jgi:nucleoside-diphosphate-sugar epimerase